MIEIDYYEHRRRVIEIGNSIIVLLEKQEKRNREMVVATQQLIDNLLKTEKL